jgi:hypothetical protein
MIIVDKVLGECALDIFVGESTVDSFVEYGYSFALHRKLTDDEVLDIQDNFIAEIQMWAYTEGGSKNHN